MSADNPTKYSFRNLFRQVPPPGYEKAKKESEKAKKHKGMSIEVPEGGEPTPTDADLFTEGTKVYLTQRLDKPVYDNLQVEEKTHGGKPIPAGATGIITRSGGHTVLVQFVGVEDSVFVEKEKLSKILGVLCVVRYVVVRWGWMQ